MLDALGTFKEEQNQRQTCFLLPTHTTALCGSGSDTGNTPQEQLGLKWVLDRRAGLRKGMWAKNVACLISKQRTLLATKPSALAAAPYCVL